MKKSYTIYLFENDCKSKENQYFFYYRTLKAKEKMEDEYEKETKLGGECRGQRCVEEGVGRTRRRQRGVGEVGGTKEGRMGL